MKIHYCFLLITIGFIISNAALLQYKYHYYNDIITIFNSLSITCPQYVQIDYAESRYNLTDISKTTCGGADMPCKNLIVYLTDFNSYTYDRPQFYASGLVHGDEIIGPTTITEFVLYFCNNTNTNQQNNTFITNILKQKLFIFTPMTNSYGYFNNLREDIDLSNNKVKIDPNRDFPYDNNHCMNTMTGRIINGIFNEFLIQSAITFHGGINVLGYPWGNFKHINNNMSTEAPDHNLFQGFGHIMLNVTLSDVNSKKNINDYILGDMTNTVYAVDGGMEDWAYAGGWEKENIKQCNNSMQEKIANGDSLKCVIFLVETDIFKKPPEAKLGIKNDINVFDFSKRDFYGHVPRNMRMIFATADLISAYFYLTIKIEDEVKRQLEVIVMGCETIMTVYQYEMQYDNNNLTRELLMNFGSEKNEPIATYENVTCFWKDNNYKIALPLNNTNENDKSNTTTNDTIFPPKGKMIYFKGINPDQPWTIQLNPDPKLPPQTHVMKSKSNSSYYITNDNYSIKTNQFFLSHPIIFHHNNHIIIDDIDALFYSDNSLKLISYFTMNHKSKLSISQVNVSLSQIALYASEIKYNLSLSVCIGDKWQYYSDENLSKMNFTKVISKIALSNSNDDYEKIIGECQIYQVIDKKIMSINDLNFFIKCANIITNVNGNYIRNRIVNSIIGINWNHKQSTGEINMLHVEGIFTMKGIENGKSFGLSNNLNTLQCTTHINTMNSNNIFSIKIMKHSNKLLNLKMTLATNMYDDLDKISYAILFPYTNQLLLLNNTNHMTGNITLRNQENRIIGKTVYVIKIQSDADMIFFTKLSSKDFNYEQQVDLIEKQMNSIKCFSCSMRKLNVLLTNNTLIINDVISIDELPKSLNEKINKSLLWLVIALNILGGITLTICCMIKCRKRFFSGYNQINNTRTEMETIQIDDIRNK